MIRYFESIEEEFAHFEASIRRRDECGHSRYQPVSTIIVDSIIPTESVKVCPKCGWVYPDTGED